MDDHPNETPATDDFASEAKKGQQGALGEMWHFLATNKKWWLAPIIIIILVVSVLVILSTTAAAPFIYTLF